MKIHQRLVASVLLLSMLLLCACAKKDETFYIKSPLASSAGEADFVVDVTIEKRKMEIPENRKIPIVIGLGRNMPSRPEDCELGYLIIETQNCYVNDAESFYQKTYEDFYTNTDFTPDVKDHYFAYPDKYPNYHEQYEITIPENVTEGSFLISLKEKININSYTIASVTVCFRIEESIIEFTQGSTAIQQDLHEEFKNNEELTT